ncbi:hypothetical protein RHSIM_Rhsim01G0040100 [Rhododendron simsii]|uniref:GH18 domain-containing protein n=1 Tax=Rhododendron simsii TaxID=118357 RepID=A0A834LZ50_RHOSS|nr:hypothetical protein RHSIM_Rhsim01G0040100 [Rhododendron simsii]
MLFTIISLLLFLPSLTNSSETWIKAGSWFSFGQFPVPDIDSTLFTHLTFAFAYLNNSTYELWIEPSDEPSMLTFTDIVQRKNPSIVTLLSIFVGDSQPFSTFYSMATQPSHRTSFIESSIQTARLYGFHGLELCCVKPDTSTPKMEAIGILFDEWRTAINRESKNYNRSPLILTLAGYYLPSKNSTSYPMESIRWNFDWVHIVSYYYHLPTTENITGAHSALYDPSSNISTDYGIKEWISRGLPADKMVLGLAYHGYAWMLVDPMANEIGSPGRGPAVTHDGSMFYKFIKSTMRCDGEKVLYSSTYVTNYCINGSVWIGYDDAEAIRTKVSYAREKGLLGYKVWHVGNDDNWVLSKAAAQEDENDPRNKRHLLLVILLSTAATVTLALVSAMCGYVPPEYVKRGIYSTKSDVYSFGVLLLQIISGKRNNCSHGLHEDLNLLDYAYDLWKCGKGMEFMDPSLDDTNSSCKLVRCMQIALLCVQENPADRPSMLELSSALKNETVAMNTPKIPAFSIRRNEDEVQASTSQQEIWSVGDASITQMVAR